jgi:hypothetical protein
LGEDMELRPRAARQWWAARGREVGGGAASLELRERQRLRLVLLWSVVFNQVVDGSD